MLQPEQAPHAANLDNGFPIRRSRILPGVSRGHAIPPRRYRAVLIAALTATLVFTAPAHAEPVELFPASLTVEIDGLGNGGFDSFGSAGSIFPGRFTFR